MLFIGTGPRNLLTEDDVDKCEIMKRKFGKYYKPAQIQLSREIFVTI